MEEKKLSLSDFRKLVQIYDKLDEIDSKLFYMSDKYPENILSGNDVREGIISSMEKIKKILRENENDDDDNNDDDNENKE
jgi:hypothetical protein